MSIILCSEREYIKYRGKIRLQIADFYVPSSGVECDNILYHTLTAS